MPGPSGTKSQPNTPTLPGVFLTVPYTNPLGTREINSRSCSKFMARTTVSCGKRATTRRLEVDSGCRTKAVPSTPFIICSDLWACDGLCRAKWVRSCRGWTRSASTISTTQRFDLITRCALPTGITIQPIPGTMSFGAAESASMPTTTCSVTSTMPTVMLSCTAGTP